MRRFEEGGLRGDLGEDSGVKSLLEDFFYTESKEGSVFKGSGGSKRD